MSETLRINNPMESEESQNIPKSASTIQRDLIQQEMNSIFQDSEGEQISSISGRPDEKLQNLIEMFIQDQRWSAYESSPDGWSTFFEMLLKNVQVVCKTINKQDNEIDQNRVQM